MTRPLTILTSLLLLIAVLCSLTPISAQWQSTQIHTGSVSFQSVTNALGLTGNTSLFLNGAGALASPGGGGGGDTIWTNSAGVVQFASQTNGLGVAEAELVTDIQGWQSPQQSLWTSKVTPDNPITTVIGSEFQTENSQECFSMLIVKVGTNDAYKLNAGYYEAYNLGSGIVTTTSGLEVRTGSAKAGSHVENAIGVRSGVVVWDVVTNGYAFYALAPGGFSPGSISNRWAFYAEPSAGPSFFSDGIRQDSLSVVSTATNGTALIVDTDTTWDGGNLAEFRTGGVAEYQFGPGYAVFTGTAAGESELEMDGPNGSYLDFFSASQSYIHHYDGTNVVFKYDQNGPTNPILTIDTSEPHTAGNLFALGNSTTNKFSVAFDGATTIAQSASEPGAPAAGHFTLFAVDSGGKMVLKVKFPTGAAQTVATEP